LCEIAAAEQIMGLYAFYRSIMKGIGGQVWL